MVTVEVDVSASLPACEIVGLPDAAVRESKERVRSAIKNSGFDYPVGRITVNLAPADMKKEGSIYDLPIALGIISATGQLKRCRCRTTSIWASWPWMAAYGVYTAFCPW